MKKNELIKKIGLCVIFLVGMFVCGPIVILFVQPMSEKLNRNTCENTCEIIDVPLTKFVIFLRKWTKWCVFSLLFFLLLSILILLTNLPVCIAQIGLLVIFCIYSLSFVCLILLSIVECFKNHSRVYAIYYFKLAVLFFLLLFILIFSLIAFIH